MTARDVRGGGGGPDGKSHSTTFFFGSTEGVWISGSRIGNVVKGGGGVPFFPLTPTFFFQLLRGGRVTGGVFSQNVGVKSIRGGYVVMVGSTPPYGGGSADRARAR